ncbi:uncharacterized protein LOC108238137, partial [Tachysurus ichikawai]
MSLKVEKANLESSIEHLQQEKDVALAIAEAEALDSAAALQLDSDCDPSPFKSAEQTKQYVKTQATLVNNGESSPSETPQNNETTVHCQQEHTSNKTLHRNRENDNIHSTPNVCLPNPNHSQYVSASNVSHSIRHDNAMPNSAHSTSKAHYLTKCRTFCMKSLDERKALVKENNICSNAVPHLRTGQRIAKSKSNVLSIVVQPYGKKTLNWEPDTAEPEKINSKCTQ